MASGRSEKELQGVTMLGHKTDYPTDYAPQVLEAFDNKHPDNDYFVKFNCPEFTSLCPMTGQPDFATIYISYVPDKKMVESKSLKLYLFSFRNHGDFHEDCINIIMKDLIKLMDPKYIEVWGKFTPRGGLSIDPYANYGKPGTEWEKTAKERLHFSRALQGRFHGLGHGGHLGGGVGAGGFRQRAERCRIAGKQRYNDARPGGGQCETAKGYHSNHPLGAFSLF